MGQLYQAVNIPATIRDFGIRAFVETGTGIGNTLDRVVGATGPDFDIYTIELMDELWEPIRARYEDTPRVRTLKGYSHECLAEVLSTLSESPTLFWHDAHFPGADFGIGGATYGSEPDPVKRIPLQAEMEAVTASGRDISRDVFIIDDLRIYCDRQFTGGVWGQRSVAGGDGYGFVMDTLRETHTVYESLIEQGMLLCFPKDVHLSTLIPILRDHGVKVSERHD